MIGPGLMVHSCQENFLCCRIQTVLDSPTCVLWWEESLSTLFCCWCCCIYCCCSHGFKVKFILISSWTSTSLWLWLLCMPLFPVSFSWRSRLMTSLLPPAIHHNAYALRAIRYYILVKTGSVSDVHPACHDVRLYRFSLKCANHLL